MSQAQPEKSAAIRSARTILLVLLSTSILFPTLYQPLLDNVWQLLRSWSVYRWSTWETLLTVFSYSAIEVPMTVAFMQHPEWRIAHEGKAQQDEPLKKPKGMRRPSRRGYEALVYVLPLLTLDLTLIKKFADVSLEAMLRSGNYDPFVAGHKSTFLVPSLHNFTLASPLQTQRALPISAPSIRRLVLELVASMVIYDALFFVFHLSMHMLPVLRTWHRAHHSHAEIHPQITNQLHTVERLGLVLLANFSLNIIGSHVLTRTFFVPLFIWLLVEIHSGLDLPWAYDRILPAGWGGGARKHALHHADGGGGLEPYFNWCDKLWDNIQKRRDVATVVKPGVKIG